MLAKPTNEVPAATRVDFDARFNPLIVATNAGDQRAAQELHEVCRAEPSLWDRLGGLEHNALISWKKLLSPGESNSAAFTRDHIDVELGRRRKQLREAGDSQLENLLINRILSAWLQVMLADVTYAQMLQHEGTVARLEYAQKRLDRAQRQLLRAIQALATVRRLLKPMQVNIGRNQINVAK